MNIPHILNSLIDYYNRTRQTGHTMTMMEGAKDKDCLLFCLNMDIGEKLKKKYNNKKITIVTPYNIDRILRGQHKPLAIDNSAMYALLWDCMAEIDFLQSVNDLENSLCKYDMKKKRKS